MTAFDNCRTLEAKAITRLLPWLEKHHGPSLLTGNGTLGPLLQKTVGDLLFRDARTGRLQAVELKAEAKWTGNLFLELWSNRNLNNRDEHALLGSTPGWLVTLRADWLFYYFEDVDRLVVLDVFALKQWAFGTQDGDGRLWAFRVAVQAKRQQANDTVGHLVPVTKLCDELDGRAKVIDLQAAAKAAECVPA